MLAILSAQCSRAKFLPMKKPSKSGPRCPKLPQIFLTSCSVSGPNTAQMPVTVVHLSKFGPKPKPKMFHQGLEGVD